MHSMPLGIIPKPHLDKLYLINDHSTGQFSCNSMIPKHEGTVKLDGMCSLGKILCHAWKQYNHLPFILWKADIMHTYHLLPMHFHWQLHQIITINGQHYINWCNFFGGWAGCCLFCTFMALMLWIAQHIFNLLDLLIYVNDNFSWEFTHCILFYPPYACYFPEKQACLLLLWDKFGIPHECHKQEFRVILKIIGYQVDISAMNISMDSKSKQNLLEAIHAFIHGTCQWSLQDFQWIAGWINQANIQPQLCSSLASLYAKITNKDQPHQLL